MKVVVDTNVAIAANGRDTHANVACQYACVEFIEKLSNSKSRDSVLLDESELILAEYKKHLNYRGQPGLGDMFYKFLHDHLYGDRVQLISIAKNDIETKGFDELPENSIDKNDRKFLAVALIGNGTIFNATDTDWQEQCDFINKLGVVVKQICPDHGCKIKG